MENTQPRLIVSACLCGLAVRYDGRACTDERLRQLWQSGDVLAVCPECMGGLPIPRAPAERQPDGRITDCQGTDRTEAYEEGARQVLALCRQNGITCAVLKENSPSCGCHFLYDGTFSGQKIAGQGVTATLLKENGVTVCSEADWDGRI